MKKLICFIALLGLTACGNNGSEYIKGCVAGLDEALQLMGQRAHPERAAEHCRNMRSRQAPEATEVEN